MITQQPERNFNLFEFAPHLCVCVSSPAAGGFTSAEITDEDAVAAEGSRYVRWSTSSDQSHGWGVKTTEGRKVQTEHRENMDTLRTCVMLVLLAPVSCEGKKMFHLFYLKKKKKKVEMCLRVLKFNCVMSSIYLFIFCYLITVKTFNGLRKIFEQDLRASILLSLLFSGVAPLNKDLSVFTFVLFEKLNYLNVGLPQDQPHQDSSLLPTELSDGNARLNVVMIQENSSEKLRAFLFLLFKLMLKRCRFVMSGVEYNYMFAALLLMYWFWLNSSSYLLQVIKTFAMNTFMSVFDAYSQ